ncbi:MAG: glycoside hydrolase family 27 protein [Bacteroidales bacterium]
MKKTKILLLLAIFSSFSGLSQSFDELARTPPMGWNSWNKFRCEINEVLVMEIADAMSESGMKDAGYQYVVIDDCWQVDRDENGELMPDPVRFPSGIKALSDYVHSLGLKFGIYSCAGDLTCQGRPGSRGHEFQDARTFAQWGVDYLKYDWCNHGELNAQASYTTMSKALRACGRPIVLSICEWGTNQPWTWPDNIGHLYRTTGDIRDCFDCTLEPNFSGTMQIVDLNENLWKYAKPGHWNDPDMLEIGNGAQTFEEYKTQFSLWSMMAAPLMAGCDLRSMSDKTIEIFTNEEVIAINQNPLGYQGFRYIDFGDLEIWVKFLSEDELAVCFLNRSDKEIKLDFDWQKYRITHRGEKFYIDNDWEMRDLWEHKNLGKTDKNFDKVVPAHGVVMLRMSGGSKIAKI